MRAMSSRGWVVAVFAVALAVRLGVVIATPAYVPHHDDRDYDRVAWSMASGRGYPPVHIHHRAYADAYRPPLWPASLGLVYAAVGHRVAAARVADAAVGALGVVLLAWVAQRLAGARAARWAGGLGAAYLPLALVSSSLVSETLFVACELLALGLALEARRAGEAAVARRGGGPVTGAPAALAVRRAGERRAPALAVAAGAAAGLAALTRVNGALLLLAVVPLARVRPRGAVVVVLAFAAVLAPWTARNALELHAFVPVSTETGGTLAGTYNRAAMADRVEPAAWRLLRYTEDAPLARRRLAPAAEDALLRRAALRFILQHPTYPLDVVWHNLRRWLDLAGPTRARFEARTIDIGPGWAQAELPFAWALAVLAALGLLTGAARGTPRAFWLAPLALLASTLLVNAETPRFRAPLDPFLLLLVAAGLSQSPHRLPRLRSRPPVSD